MENISQLVNKCNVFLLIMADIRIKELASAESFNAKVKAFRAQFKGVRDISFFIFRLPEKGALSWKLSSK